MFTALWALIPTTVKWLVVVAIVGAFGVGAWKWEHAAKLKAQAAKATAEMGMQIGYEGYVKLYQDREAIKAKTDKQRSRFYELQRANDLDGLADNFNGPGGVRSPRSPNPPGGSKAPARQYRAQDTGDTFQEAP